MKHCPTCQAAYPDEALFCGNDGARLVASAPMIAAPPLPSHAPPPVSYPPAPPPPPSNYLPAPPPPVAAYPAAPVAYAGAPAPYAGTPGYGLPPGPLPGAVAPAMTAPRAKRGKRWLKVTLGIVAFAGLGLGGWFAANAVGLDLLFRNPTDPYNQWDLGDRYREGKNTRQNYAKAAYWYRKVVDQNSYFVVTTAIYLGDLYAWGSPDLPQDFAEAARWYRFIADRDPKLVETERSMSDVARAQVKLAQLSEWGVGGLPRDLGEALRWYRRAAALGNDYAKSRAADLSRGNAPARSVPAAPVVAVSPPAAPVAATAPAAAPTGGAAIAAAEIERAFKMNPAAAQARFKNKLVALSGVITYARLNLQGQPFVGLVASSDGDSVICNFPMAAKGTVTALRAGQTVTIRGVCETVPNTSLYQLNNCELVR